MQTRKSAGMAAPRGHDDGHNEKKSRFTSWMEIWRNSMRRWRLGHASSRSADVEEIAQEVYLRVLQCSDDVLVDAPQDHLFRIATNITNEWQEQDGAPPLDDDGSHFIEGALVNEHARLAVNKLPSQQREALLMHVNEKLTYRQIAIRMKLPPRVVRRDIARAYSILRDELSSTQGGNARRGCRENLKR
jgi:DNA-directed RNA polymerase specialized sigma24 family protein